jgi:hypothetical protein
MENEVPHPKDSESRAPQAEYLNKLFRRHVKGMTTSSCFQEFCGKLPYLWLFIYTYSAYEDSWLKLSMRADLREMQYAN